MISALLGIVVFALKVLSWALLIYCVMSFVMPQSDLFVKLYRYVEPLLTPIRNFLFRLFPVLGRLAVDVSPLAVWLAIEVTMTLLNLLRRVL